MRSLTSFLFVLLYVAFLCVNFSAKADVVRDPVLEAAKSKVYTILEELQQTQISLIDYKDFDHNQDADRHLANAQKLLEELQTSPAGKTLSVDTRVAVAEINYANNAATFMVYYSLTSGHWKDIYLFNEPMKVSNINFYRTMLPWQTDWLLPLVKQLRYMLTQSRGGEINQLQEILATLYGNIRSVEPQQVQPLDYSVLLARLAMEAQPGGLKCQTALVAATQMNSAYEVAIKKRPDDTTLPKQRTENNAIAQRVLAPCNQPVTSQPGNDDLTKKDQDYAQHIEPVTFVPIPIAQASSPEKGSLTLTTINEGDDTTQIITIDSDGVVHSVTDNNVTKSKTEETFTRTPEELRQAIEVLDSMSDEEIAKTQNDLDSCVNCLRDPLKGTVTFAAFKSSGQLINFRWSTARGSYMAGKLNSVLPLFEGKGTKTVTTEGGTGRAITMETNNRGGGGVIRLYENGLLTNEGLGYRTYSRESTKVTLPAELVQDIFKQFDILSIVKQDQLMTRGNIADAGTYHLFGKTKDGQAIDLSWSGNTLDLPQALQQFKFLWHYARAPVISFLRYNQATPLTAQNYTLLLDGTLTSDSNNVTKTITTIPYARVKELLQEAERLNISNQPFRLQGAGNISRFQVQSPDKVLGQEISWSDKDEKLPAPQVVAFFNELMALVATHDTSPRLITWKETIGEPALRKEWQLSDAGQVSMLFNGKIPATRWTVSVPDTKRLFEAFDAIPADAPQILATFNTDALYSLQGETADNRELDLHWNQEATQKKQPAELFHFLDLWESLIRAPHDAKSVPAVEFDERDDAAKINRSFVLYSGGQVYEVHNDKNILINTISESEADDLSASGMVYVTWSNPCGSQSGKPSTTAFHFRKIFAGETYFDCRWSKDEPAVKEIQEYFQKLKNLVPSGS